MVNKPTKINLKSNEHIKRKRVKNNAGERRVFDGHCCRFYYQNVESIYKFQKNIKNFLGNQ